jgi:hypothetical protein
MDAALRGEAETAIDAVFAIEKPVGIQKGFRVVAAPAEVTIAGFKRKIAVVTVFAVLKIKRLARHGMEQIAVLHEERAIEIECSAKCFCVPAVAPPTASVIDRKRRSFGIHGEHLFFACIALSMMEVALIAPHHFPLQTASAAKRRRREYSDGE